MVGKLIKIIAVNRKVLMLFAVSFLLCIGFPKTFASQPLIIGIDADMSSVAAEGGNAIYRGAKIAVDEINADGGLLGRPVELVVKDHRGNPARGIRNLKEFSDLDGLLAVLGGVHTPVVLSELDLIHQKQMLFLVPWAAGTAIIDNNKQPNFIFRASVRDSEAASIMLTGIRRTGCSRIALILERTGWGRSNQASITQAAAENDISIEHIAWINWRQKSFEDEVQQIADSNAEAIVLVTNAPEGAVALEELWNNEKTKSKPIVSHWGIAGGNFVELLGKDKLKGLNLQVLQTFHFAKPKNSDISEKVLNKYKSQFDTQATENNIPGKVGLAHAYDLVKMLAIATENANSTDALQIRGSLIKLESYSGVVKTYNNPFAKSQDALWAEDYILTRYNDQGYLIPNEQ